MPRDPGGESRGESPRPRRATLALAALLIAWHVIAGAWLARRDSLTFDENSFITGGISHWATGDWRLNPEGAPLPQRLATLPVVLAGIRFPTTDQPAWHATDVVTLGHQLFYELGNDREAMVFRSRLVIVIVSALLAVGIFACAFALFGDAGSLVALSLWCLHPVVLAHAHLVTADIVATACFFAASAAAWRVMWRVSTGRVLTSLLATGLLAIAKMSAVLFAPMWLALVVLRLLAGGALPMPGARAPVRARAAQAGVIGLLTLSHLAAAIVVIWAVHGFRYETFRGPASRTDVLTDGGWEALGDVGWSDGPVTFARQHHLLPEPTLFGFRHVMSHGSGRITTALGQYSDHGWWWFYPLLALLKTPISAIVIAVAAVLAIARAWTRGERATLAQPDVADAPTRRAFVADSIALAPWLVLPAVYGAAAVAANIHEGLRHLLPMFPAACIVAGLAGTWVATLQGRRIIIALGVLLLIESALALPHALAWMNPLIAAPERRWHFFAGSSLDWGQPLHEVRDFVDEESRRGQPCTVAAFSPLDLHAEGINARILPSWRDTWRAPDGDPLAGGTYVVSATILSCLDGRYPGPWCERYEWLWSKMRAWDEAYRRATPEELLTTFAADGPFAREKLLPAFERLRLARLCATLRHLSPDACLGGGAALAFRLSDAQVKAAIEGPPPELLPGEPVVRWGGASMQGLPPLPSSGVP